MNIDELFYDVDEFYIEFDRALAEQQLTTQKKAQDQKQNCIQVR